MFSECKNSNRMITTKFNSATTYTWVYTKYFPELPPLAFPHSYAYITGNSRLKQRQVCKIPVYKRENWTSAPSCALYLFASVPVIRFPYIKNSAAKIGCFL